jgi:hypothetical protein
MPKLYTSRRPAGSDAAGAAADAPWTHRRQQREMRGDYP